MVHTERGWPMPRHYVIGWPLMATFTESRFFFCFHGRLDMGDKKDQPGWESPITYQVNDGIACTNNPSWLSPVSFPNYRTPDSLLIPPRLTGEAIPTYLPSTEYCTEYL